MRRRRGLPGPQRSPKTSISELEASLVGLPFASSAQPKALRRYVMRRTRQGGGDQPEVVEKGMLRTNLAQNANASNKGKTSGLCGT